VYDPTTWPTVGAFFEAIDRFLEASPLINGPVSIPLSAVLALLLLWGLLRLVRLRAASGEAQSVETAPDEDIQDAEITEETTGVMEPEPTAVHPEPKLEAVEAPAELVAEDQPSDEEIEAELEAVADEVFEEVLPEEIVVEPEPEPEPKPAPKLSLFARLRKGLTKTAGGLVGRIDQLVRGRKIDDEFFEELEEILFTADLGPTTAEKLLTHLQERVREENIEDAVMIRDILQEEIAKILRPHEAPLDVESSKPFIVMVVGVNGVGKTTTIGKIAKKFADEGKRVIFGAADTFRAAADEQLQVWADRAGAEIIKQKPGADPAAVAYDTVQAAVNREVDLAIIDTAGRLHTKHNLMEELKKIKRVMSKLDAAAPHEVLLVLDANTGQNAIQQAKSFHEALGLTGLILTKLDGTAKGGCIVGICDELEVPVRYIGIGEQMDDLRPFIADDFVQALFEAAKG